MKKLFLLLILLPGLAWADLGTSTDGKEASVTCTHSLACDSGWVVFGYDGDAGEVDTANMYDSLKVLPCFSGNGKTLCGDGLDLDSIGTHVVKIYYFFGDAIIDIQVGIWEHKDGAAGGSDTTSIKAMMQKNWDPDTDGELSVETSTGADSSVMKKMMQNNWDPDTDGELSVELPAGVGSDTLDIIVFDGDTTAVEGVDLCIYNPTKTAKAVPSIETDVNGYCHINSDPGSYPVWCQRLGVIQAEWDTVTVPSGGGRDTIWVVAQPAGSPPSANVTRLTGYNRDLGYNKHDRLKIVMRPQHGNLLDTCQNVFIITKEMVAYSDTGFFQIDVPPSKCLLSKDGPVDIDSVLYDFLIFYKYNKEFERRGIFVPDSTGNVQVKDLLD